MYSIQVTVSGFDVAVSSKNLTLQVAQVLQQDFRLKVGNVKQQVTVSAGAPLLNTETTDLGNVISRDPIIQLPLNGRNFSQLALLVPGTNPGEVGGTRSTGNGNETARNGANVVADGARGSFNTYLIDGLNDNDQLIGTIKVFPNLEDVQEFKVQIGNYDAEYMSGGAVVNVTTVSGSNQLHGSAFEFLRNFALDTRQYFDAPTPSAYKQISLEVPWADRSAGTNVLLRPLPGFPDSRIIQHYSADRQRPCEPGISANIRSYLRPHDV